jgi:tetratricopeptide (TPR) repeat protein
MVVCCPGIRAALAQKMPGAGEIYKQALDLLDAGRKRDAAAAMIRAIRALPDARTAPSKPSPSSERHCRQGLQHMRVRRDSLAEKEFRKAIDIDPGNPAPRYQLAFILGNKGDYRGMFRELWKVVKTPALPSEKLRALAGLSLLAGNSTEARACYREALAVDPSSPEVMRMLGLVLVERGARREGFDLLQKALKERPDDYSTLSAAGLAYALGGDYGRAVEYLKRAIDLNGDHPEAQGRLGLVLLLQGNTQESIQRLSEAVKLNPGVAELHVNLAKAYTIAGRLDDADAHYTLALKADPGNYDAWYEKGNILGMGGKTDKALEAYRKAAEIEPMLAKAYYKMGLVYARKRLYDKAEGQFKKTIRANCDYADAYYAIAVLKREHAKDYRAAAHYYNMYLLYDASSERAAEARRWLEQQKKGETP